jgi:GTP-binding protein
MVKCNNPDSFSKTYRRYLLSVLRDSLEFGEVPIRMVLEKRSSADPNVALEETAR